MRKFLMAAAAGALLTAPAFAETVVIDSAPAPVTTTRTTTTVTSTDGTMPGDEIPAEVTTYVQQNPIDAAPVLEGRLVDGAIIPPDVTLTPVQGYSGYSYFYQDGAPVIVNSDRKVIRIVR
ncbi:DUF1236 domain-containing protein [Aureimonas leprariae]|uniref:DUF1236 domain-containing protein n=1 Tax=Plantimonas leprariae TaxID=2615207 RepID=A0A7V7PM22_9HYPH|nr:DUF1236 domain-containing protein [Aureimonas leprariae]KAB0677772.1 DUF1236 domain-containing protein [Aureimonas leprariae]